MFPPPVYGRLRSMAKKHIHIHYDEIPTARGDIRELKSFLDGLDAVVHIHINGGDRYSWLEKERLAAVLDGSTNPQPDQNQAGSGAARVQRRPAPAAQ